MEFLKPDTIAAMRAHAEACLPAESCGLVLTGEGYRPCKNIAADPVTSFKINPKLVLDQLKVGRLQAVIHSHPHPFAACPSEADMQCQLATAVPFGIVPVGEDGTAEQPFFWGDGVPVPPLIGRAYRHGVTDCYSIIRDYYAARGAQLNEYPRAWAWWKQAEHADFYKSFFARELFREVPARVADVGDTVLIQLGDKTVSHAGVIVEPGVMLHHPGGDLPYDPARLSKRDPLARWHAHIDRVIRYAPALGPEIKIDD